MITVLIFIGRNVTRLAKEYKNSSYRPLVDVNYPLKKSSFRYQKRMYEEIKEKKAKEIYKNRYIFF